MIFSPTGLWRLLRQTAADWSEDRAAEKGAALAFYSALSIAPLLVIALAVVGLVYGEDAAKGELSTQLTSLVGAQAGEAIEEMAASANKPAEGSIAAALSVVTLVLGASGVFGQLQSSLNDIWEVQSKPGGGVMTFLRKRFWSMAMVLGVAFLLLVSLILSAALTALGTMLDRMPDSMHWLAQGLHLLVSIGVVTLLFAMMFRLLPDVKIRWNDVWLGAFVTAVLFSVGKFAIGLYLGHSSMASSYGAAGSFVVLLVWVYYSAQIFFFGAELTQAYASARGTRIEPAEGAERVRGAGAADQSVTRGAMRRPA